MSGQDCYGRMDTCSGAHHGNDTANGGAPGFESTKPENHRRKSLQISQLTRERNLTEVFPPWITALNRYVRVVNNELRIWRNVFK